jgi:hypothetical protein
VINDKATLAAHAGTLIEMPAERGNLLQTLVLGEALEYEPLSVHLSVCNILEKLDGMRLGMFPRSTTTKWKNVVELRCQDLRKVARWQRMARRQAASRSDSRE